MRHDDFHDQIMADDVRARLTRRFRFRDRAELRAWTGHIDAEPRIDATFHESIDEFGILMLRKGIHHIWKWRIEKMMETVQR